MVKKEKGYQAKTLQRWQSSDVCSKQGRVEKHGEEGLVVDGDLTGHTMVCAPEHVGDPLRQMYKYLQMIICTRHRNICTWSFAPDVQIFVNNQSLGLFLPLIAKEQGTCMTRQHWMKSSKHTAFRPVLSNLRSRRRYTWENTWIHLGADKGAGIFRWTAGTLVFVHLRTQVVAESGEGFLQLRLVYRSWLVPAENTSYFSFLLAQIWRFASIYISALCR